MDGEDEDFIYYGTPLPDIEDEFELRKKAARELEVRDEKGRQRFHGAFTGGFSAGYFNTVGTKEGWAPSSFVSSRNKNAERIQQNPEDFMDEEDLGEFGIATRKIHTSHKFKDASGLEIKKRKFDELNNVIPGEAPLKQIVKPVRDTIGVEILKKLGWRPGQGIGPRVKKKQGNTEKVYGCALPDTFLPEENDPFALAYTFAPEDTDEIFFQPKDNHFGIGYVGLSKHSVLTACIDPNSPTTTKSFLKKDKRKLAISGQAFGVGAFEDDDEDIYSKDDMSQYDFSDLNKEADQSSHKLGNKAVKNSSSGMIEGFCLASQPSLIKKYYPPPELPADFIPKFSNLLTSRWDRSTTTQPISRHNLTSEERSYLLGEKKFQSIDSKTASLPIKENKQEKISETKSSSNNTNFKPFCNDDAKQKRYEEFLKLKESAEIDKLTMPVSMTEWEKQQELEEFSRASILFQTSSAVLSSRFESRSHLSVEHEVMDAINKAKKEKEKKSSLVKKKLVGLKNRKTFDWYPDKLLCRRFNVPNPYPNEVIPSGSSTSRQSKSLFSHITFDSKEIKNVDSKNNAPPVEKAIHSVTQEVQKNSNKSSEEYLIEKAEEKSKENVPENDKKPSMDFFKDIFENSSSEEETNPEDIMESDKVQSTIVIEKDEALPLPEKNQIPQETRPAPKKSSFGVFANLDLDALNQRTVSKTKLEVDKNEPVPNNSCEIETKENPSRIKAEESVDLYGPELPPNYSEYSATSTVKYVKKHKSKSKHHKHKSKKKKKKKHSYRSSDSYSSDSDADINPEIILEKFKKLQKKM